MASQAPMVREADPAVGVQGSSPPPGWKTSNHQRNIADSRGGMMCDPTAHTKKQECLTYAWKSIQREAKPTRSNSDLQAGMRSVESATLKRHCLRQKWYCSENWLKMQ